ncbi:MAG: TIM barrel protein [Armatimonadota bacterium]|nr:TIM barrel protein [Armatimonadota bacterium]
MRLGGPVFGDWSDPEKWAMAVRARGYRAAFCPLDANAPNDTIQAYKEAAKKADIVIAEVGAWSNPLSPDEATRRNAFEKCIAALALAEEIGARCCVNISGSRGDQWDGPHSLNLTNETFEMIVETVRAIIDAINPKHTFYTLETMPWMYPDSSDSYLSLIKAIDRRAFAVHFDPVNLINCPEKYFTNGALIRDFVAKLGTYIKSVHAKDIFLTGELTVHLQEVRPGLGNLDYHIFLSSLANLDPDLTVMLEHLNNDEEYRLATEYVLNTMVELNIG